MLPDPRAAGAGGQRPAPGRRRAADDRRDRALGRPRRQHLQGGAPHLRPRVSTRELRGIIQQDGRAGAAAVRRGDRGVPSRATRPRPPPSTTWTRTSTACSKQFVQAIFESHAAGRIDLQVAVQLAVVARFYERIGDHAVNIGERVRYIVTGWLPEHNGAARYRRAPARRATGRPRAVAVGARADDAGPLRRRAIVGPPSVRREHLVAPLRRRRAGGAPRHRAPSPAERPEGGPRRRRRRWARRSTLPLGVVVIVDADGVRALRNRAGRARRRHPRRRCSSTRPSRSHLRAGASRGRSGARRSSCSGRRALVVRVRAVAERRPAGRRPGDDRGRHRAAPGSTRCAPTSSPTSATS